MAKYTIYRDDRDYPISADTFEELRELRTKGNRSFISHGYGPVCVTSEVVDSKRVTKYYDIYTEKEVPASERCW